MSNAGILVVTFIITITIVVLFFYYSSQIKKRDSQTLESDWKAFQNAVQQHRISTIKDIGSQLIYNENISEEQVREMSNIIKMLENDHKELTDLKWIIYNKRKDWSKKYPRYFDGHPM
ncbi:hypothetical protein A9Q93_05685 [Nonlabens dokdonensis]|uniref:Uncharacterized protein n=2 Tax=Nonlabens dokdonensis TaxID=328515 RepID=A0A1Z8B1Q7_9FLAO|nr:hypothetical protein [Nonlabens dokdonensis]OUS16507.1 hypothetical protein A9Q93_05685 [Nonlabens dokdonensis]